MEHIFDFGRWSEMIHCVLEWVCEEIRCIGLVKSSRWGLVFLLMNRNTAVTQTLEKVPEVSTSTQVTLAQALSTAWQSSSLIGCESSQLESDWLWIKAHRFVSVCWVTATTSPHNHWNFTREAHISLHISTYLDENRYFSCTPSETNIMSKLR